MTKILLRVIHPEKIETYRCQYAGENQGGLTPCSTERCPYEGALGRKLRTQGEGGAACLVSGYVGETILAQSSRKSIPAKTETPTDSQSPGPNMCEYSRNLGNDITACLTDSCPYQTPGNKIRFEGDEGASCLIEGRIGELERKSIDNPQLKLVESD